MENTHAYKWVVILFFGVVGIMFSASMIYLATGNVDPTTFFGRKITLPKTDKASAGFSKETRVLELGKQVVIGNRIFTYKGCQDDAIRFDVIIPEIDRQYPYPFKIDIRQSRNGFEVAGIWLQLVTVRDNFVSLRTPI
ncbi:hypothetical protein [uncultured Desulfosarcina sp.]|uniref:hypothetical protein n=1 Tax=uncultured Desulfosarcina sp. TaxID=218289 RepID=UPI0029C607E2|nr:hypothetical protein [uncultured Desulfosarcina sp.]